jgi:hypothetical protein
LLPASSDKKLCLKPGFLPGTGIFPAGLEKLIPLSVKDAAKEAKLA